MTKDYCEILLDSVRTVVDFETQKQKYKADHVEICTIIDNSGAQDEDIVYYWVQNDAGQKYQVNSVLKNLRLGDQLYVQILSDGQGRTVLGRKLSDANLPISVVRAFDRFFSLESFTKENFIEEKYIVSLHEKYTRLGIECKVNDGDETDSIILNIRLNNGDSYNITFSTEDMLGDPSTFENILQKKIFDISNLGDKIKEISYSISNTERFSDIVISLGYDLDSLKEETPLHLYTNNSTEYKTDINSNFVEGENGARTLAWRWIYEDDNGNLQGISSAETIPEGYKCYLYEYDEDNDTGDMYGGLNWQRIEYTTKVTLKPLKQENKYKLVITYNGTYIVSNELVFVNKQMEKPTAIKNLKFKFDDGSNGQYPYYEYDGYLAEAFVYEGLVNRTVSAQFQMENTAKVTKVVWTVPMDLITVVAAGGIAGALGEEIEINAGDDISELFNLKYKIKETCNFSGENDQYLKCAIYVEGEDAPYTYEQQIVLRVEGSNGTDNYVVARFYNARSGLKHSTKPEETTYLEVNVYNGDGIDITNKIVSVGCSWHGQIYNYEYDEFGVLKQLEDGKVYSDLISLSQEKDEEGNSIPNQFVITFKNTALTMFDCCKYISPILHLEITLSGEKDTPILTKDLTLPIRYDNVVYQGPTIIQYNYEGGSPKCVSSSPQLLKKDTGEVIEGLKWFLATNDKFSGYPEYDLNKNVLIPRSSYDSTLGIADNREYYLCNLIGYKDKNEGDQAISKDGKSLNAEKIKQIYWIQPIQIIQNRYFSTIIDDWDGQMEINEEGNYILASTLAAGTKNNYNQFSGAIIGTFGTLIDGEKKTETGIKGFKDGAQVYEFNDSGEAIIGPSGSGQIKFDGWNGSITSGGFDGKINPTANKAIQSLDDIGTKGSYWNLNTGELITNDGYFRGTLHANKLFISDEVKEESGIVSKTSFKNYADADQAIFESEIEYVTHKADTETRANARISSFVDEQQAINSLQASYSFDKQGVPTENYIVSWGTTKSDDESVVDITAPEEIDPTRIYNVDEGYSDTSLIWYGGLWDDYFIVRSSTTYIYQSAFSDVHKGIKVYYVSDTAPGSDISKENNSYNITIAPLPKHISPDSYPRMSWDTSKKYYYDDKLWYCKEGAWQDDGELFKDITDVKDNSRIALWYPKLRYRCENFYVHQYKPLSFSWEKKEQEELPESGYLTDPGKEKRLLNNTYYSKEPTHLVYNGTLYAIAPEEENSNLNKEFFRNGGGAYRETDGTYKYWTNSPEGVVISKGYIYYSHEFNAYYKYVEDTETEWLAVASWVKTIVNSVKADPTDEKNLGLWNPKHILEYNNHYYSYDFQGNKWIQRETQTYSSVTNADKALKTNNFNNRTSYIFLISDSPTEGYIYSSSPKGEWQLFRIDEDKATFKYSKYEAEITQGNNNKDPVIGPVPYVRELDPEMEEGIILYNKDYYICGLAQVAEGEEPYSNFYKLDSKKDIVFTEYKDSTPEINNEVYLTINNYIDRLCTYPQSENGEEILEPDVKEWTYDKQFDDSTISTNDKVYTVDESLGWLPEEKDKPTEIYHIFDIDHIYKVGDDFYEYDETSGWHKIKTAAATSASLVQWANAQGAQSALTTQFVAGLNKTIKTVPSFNLDDANGKNTNGYKKENCYYDLSTGNYYVWDSRKWVIYEPSMSTSAQIKQTANEAMAQIALIANYDITVEEIKTGSWSENNKDVKKAYYVKTEDKTYLYIDKEEIYDNYIAVGYELSAKAESFTPGWYSVGGKLQRSISSITQRATGLESRMSLTVGYGDNANLTQKIIKNPAEFDAEYGNFSDDITLVYIRDKYPVSTLWSSIIKDSGYYIYIKSPEELVSYGASLPESIDINNEEIKIPKMTGISMAADAAGGSIDMLFGPGEGHILQLQESGDVYLRADKIDFSVGEGMKIQGNKSSSSTDIPVFWLQADKSVGNDTYIDVLRLGGAKVKLDYIAGLNFVLGTRLGGYYDDYVFAITTDISTDVNTENDSITTLGGFLKDGSLNVPLIKATDTEDLKTGNLTGKSQTTGEGESSTTTYPLISNYEINAKQLLAEKATINGVQIGHNGVTTKTGQIILNRLVSDNSTTAEIVDFKLTNCDIPDYLKKNSLDVSDLDNKIGFNRFAYDGTGTNGMVYYYSLNTEVDVENSNNIGKVTYNGKNYYLVKDRSSSYVGSYGSVISVPNFSAGNYFTIGNNVSTSTNIQQYYVPAWERYLYSGQPFSVAQYFPEYKAASSTVHELKAYIITEEHVGKGTALISKLITQDDVGKMAYNYTDDTTTYYELLNTQTQVLGYYSMGDSQVWLSVNSGLTI